MDSSRPRKVAEARRLFAAAVEAFNAERFFDAHELWEEVWTPARPPDRRFLQGLIHVAVGFYHAQRDNRIGAVRQLRKALDKLGDYPDEYDGVAVLTLRRETAEILEILEAGRELNDFCRLHQVSAYPGPRAGWDTLETSPD